MNLAARFPGKGGPSRCRNNTTTYYHFCSSMCWFFLWPTDFYSEFSRSAEFLIGTHVTYGSPLFTLSRMEGGVIARAKGGVLFRWFRLQKRIQPGQKFSAGWIPPKSVYYSPKSLTIFRIIFEKPIFILTLICLFYGESSIHIPRRLSRTKLQPPDHFVPHGYTGCDFNLYCTWEG